VLGLYRLSGSEGGDVLEWAPDLRHEAAGNALEFWDAGAEESQHPSKTRPPLPQNFLSKVPKWIPLIARVLKETK
jgi:hypothetical protein